MSIAHLNSQPLNPLLYRALRQHFGSVVIANEGEGMQVQYLPSILGDGGVRAEILVAGEYYRVCCPYCRDTRHRLWINHQFGQPDARGLPQTWLAHCFNEHCLASFERRRELEQRLFGFRNANERRQPMEISRGDQSPLDLGPVTMPGQCFRLDQLPIDHPAVRYLRDERRHDIGYLSQYFGVSFCTSPDPQYRIAGQRIVVPIWQCGSLIGWQCRYAGELNWKATGIPKYYTRPGLHKSKMLYNLDSAKLWPFVVVVEGVTSVWRIGGPAVACLGKTVSGRQQSLLYEHWSGKPVLLLLDPDAREEMEGTLDEMQRVGRVQVLSINLPAGTDPDNYSHETIVSIIRGQAAQRGVQLPEW